MAQRARVLIVDDEGANRRLLADLVTREGYTAVTAAGGAEALAALTTEPMDLVLLDMMMPEVDGMAVLAALQRRGMLPALPVVVVTAHEERAVRLDALTAGAIDFVTKPIDRFEIACKVRTLTELKALRDAALKDAVGARAQLRAVIDSAPDYVLSLRRDGVIEYANRALPPHTREQLVGASWVSLAPTAEAREARAAALERVLQTGASLRLAGTEAGPDGGHRDFESHLGPVQLDGETVGAVIVARDVTEKKRTEAQLMISDRMASVGTLAAGVAHEINNPLAAVTVNIDLALRVVEALAPERGRDRFHDLRDELRDARDSAERIRMIVRDLSLFSRAEEADRVEPVDLRRVLESTLRMAWNEIRHRARLVKDYGATPHVLGNESRLGQVFLNLLVNAAQAIPEGDAEHNEIRVVTSVDPDGMVRVDVRDTGSGIPRERLGRLFTPFYTTKPAGVGTGLGLSICHRIVTGLGGEVSVESQVGKGTTFSVRLRSTAADSAERPPSAPPRAQAAPRRGRVLVIDDEPMVGQVMRRTLAREHDVTCVERAREALDLLLNRAVTFDVIFCDLMMPQTTGMDLYDALRAGGAAEVASRIIFVTGGAFTPRAREFLDRATNLRIEKPFDPMQLRTLVNERLRGASPQGL